ncbi:kinase-like domain-containing protein [Suillus plorans]|uniref:non-specific serine/threonine protein kinase n=1 Tax=Suillus plorans TaxID=116603 RepID=A0A9P7AJP0_9AGAM|nr:kinase-like domain-containing protein [Suillus plorans]KAG1790851.1 kinase-like domain-containing protein [Suillus plorans]
MNKVPVRVDGRFRLGDVLGSGSYAVVYRAQNIINDDVVAIKLEPIVNNSSSLQCKYHILKQLEGGVSIPHVLWFGRESIYHALALELLGSSLHDIFLSHDQKFSLHTVVNLGDQLLSCLEYIHSHNYVHGDIKPQNVVVGLDDLRHTAFIIDFGIAKEYCNTSTRMHIPFRHDRRLTGTPAFASINNHLGVEPGRCDDLESLAYMLIYFLCGSLPWLSNDHEKTSSAAILERKINTTVEALCHGIPVEFASILVYSRSLAFSEDPDHGYLRLLLHGLRATLPASATRLLDFNKPDDLTTHTPAFSNEYRVTEVTPPCLLKEMPLRQSTRM